MATLVPLVIVFWLPRIAPDCRKMLQLWADKNGFALVSADPSPGDSGPFRFVDSLTVTTVYRIEVRESDGSTRRAWARCGGRFVGLLSGRVEVRWDADS